MATWADIYFGIAKFVVDFAPEKPVKFVALKVEQFPG